MQIDSTAKVFKEIRELQRGGVVVGLEWNQTTDTYTRLGLAKGLSAGIDFNNIYPWNNMRRCNLADNGHVLAYLGDPTYKEDGSNGQVMVDIPQFYYRFELDDSTEEKIYRWWISAIPLFGFKLHPAFVRAGQIKRVVRIGAYEGSIYDTSEGAYLLNDEQVADFDTDLLCSIAGAKPCSGVAQALYVVNARKIAQNRGAGWQQQDFLTVSAIQMLLMMEYGTFDSQTAIGKGVTTKTDDGKSNMAEVTGQTAHLGNSSGMAEGEDGLASVSYRGIENLWGNIWKFVDGINIEADNKPWIADHGFESDKFAEPYKYIGAPLANTNGYFSDLVITPEFDYGFLPLEATGSATTKLCDYYYQSTGNRVARLGGAWTDDVNAGAFYWRLSVSSAHRGRDYGTRLLHF